MRFAKRTLALLSLLSLEALASPEARIADAARDALIGGKPDTVLRVWLLNNAVEFSAGKPNPERPELLAALWLAIGRTGHCPTGLAPDVHGLWTIAAHNAILQSMHGRPAPEPAAPFDGFQIREQHRFVSYKDVLSRDELLSLKIHPARPCRSWRILTQDRKLPLALPDLADRRVAATELRAALRVARERLQGVIGKNLLEARLFDLNLFLADTGDAEVNAILDAAERWSADDWLRLAPERRLFLFARMRERNPQAQPTLPLELVDRLSEARQGLEVMQWIAFWNAGQDAEKRRAVWEGTRGSRLLSLDAETGFTARAAVALQRGMGFLEAGDVKESLRSFAWALRHANENQGTEAEASLARRWMAFVAGSYETDASLMAVLKEILARNDLTPILEELAWRAALRADRKSFDAALAAIGAGHGPHARLQRIAPLASGRRQEFLAATNQALAEEPYAALKFLKTFLEVLETEDANIRTTHSSLLRTLEGNLERVGEKGRLGRTAQELQTRMATLQQAPEGSQTFNEAQKARRFAAPVFAGSVRIPPPGELPWPFAKADPRPPAVFVPIRALPDAEDQTRWRLSE